MEFKNLIQASAQVIQITQLSKWDTFKMITEQYSSPELKYWIVTDVLNDWSKWFVTAIVIKSDYSWIDKEVKLLSEKEMEKTAIFPTTWAEIKLAMQDWLERMERWVKEAEETLIKKKQSFQFAKDILSWEYLPQTQEPKFQILPQLNTDN